MTDRDARRALLALFVAIFTANAAVAADRHPLSDCCGYSVAGTVYYDINSNGVQDGGEPPLGGWTVDVLDASNVLVSSTTTNALGQYSFSVPVGCGATFKLKQVVQSGWAQTFPPANGLHIGSGTGCAGEIYGPYDFGNVDNNCSGLTQVYTLDGDFNLGTLSGVVTNSDQLELSPTPTTWPYAWIANAGEGTISKINTQTGREVGRYFAGPPDGGGFHWYLSPSRTVIDKDGNCWVANRVSAPDTASVTMIVIDGGDDRNGNSIIDTSTDLNSNGIIEPAEMLPWGQDERVKRHYQVGNLAGDQARGMVIDKSGKLWVGLSVSLSLIQLDPNLPIATYAPNQPPAMPTPILNVFTGRYPYGLALAPSGLIYMSTLSTWAFEFDPGVASGGTILGPALTDSIDHSPAANYGLAVDKDCNVWFASPSHPRCIRWDTAANTWSVSGPGAPAPGRGITIDFNNNAWMTSGDPTFPVVRYNNTASPTVFGVYPTTADWPIGIGVASDGNLIVSPSMGDWAKVNSTTGALMPLAGPQLTGLGPYTYSDFTGSLQALSALQQGTWSVITDGLSPSIVWTLVGWTPSTPPGTSIQIQARVAQTLPLLALASWTTIGAPGPLGSPMPGRYIETRATLQRANEGCSPAFVTPILYDLTVQAVCDTCQFVLCAPDTTLPCETAQGAIFEYMPPVLESSCDSTFQVSCSPPSGSVFPIGVTPVVCTAVNASGDTVICQFNVTVLPGCDPTPTGACCLNNNCQVLTEHDCLAQGGIYFGNGSGCTVGCNYDCVPPPHHMAGWWKLDPAAGGNEVPNLATPGAPGTLVNGPTPLAGENVGGAYQFDGATQYVEVPHHEALDIGSGDFSIDAWVKTTAAVGVQPIVDQRGGPVTQGFSLNLVNGYPGLQLAVGGQPHNFALSDVNGGPAAFVADGQWHLLAVSVDRDSSEGLQFYVDGAAVGGAFDPRAAQGSLDSPAPLWLARSQPLPVSRYFAGALDEIEIIMDHASAEKFAEIYAAGPAGKCPELCYATQNVPCCAGTISSSSFTICNYDNVSHVYSYGLSPINGGPGCAPFGPTSFTPNTGTVTVPAGGCVTVPITIACPSNIPVGQAACYQISLFNHDTGRLFACKGSVRRPNKWCIQWQVATDVPVLGVLPVDQGVTMSLEMKAKNLVPGPAPSDLNFELRALGDHHSDEPSGVLSLNGLPPGEPVIGTLSIAPGQSEELKFTVQYPTAWRIGYERIALYGDDDGDGLLEHLGEMAVRGVPPEGSVGVPGGAGDGAGVRDLGRMFTAVPNPFGTTGAIRFRLPGTEPVDVKLRLFDVFGRSVKIMHMERRLSPGEHVVPWTTVDDSGVKLGSGMYFLKLEAGKRTETVKVVIRQ